MLVCEGREVFHVICIISYSHQLLLVLLVLVRLAEAFLAFDLIEHLWVGGIST